MKLLILCGGKGTRLRSVVSSVPKPLAPIGGKPFLEILLKQYRQAGFSDVTLSTGYLASKIADFVSNLDSDINIDLVCEAEALGTGGAVRYVIDQKGYSEKFLVVNGDTLLENLPKVGFFENLADKSDYALVGSKFSGASGDRYGSFSVTNSGQLAIQNCALPSFTSYGLYLLDPIKFSSIVDLDHRIGLDEVFSKIIMAEGFVQAVEVPGSFIDIGIPKDYFLMKEKYENSFS